MQETEHAGPLGSEEHVPQPDRSRFGWFFLVTALVAVSVISMILVPNFFRPKTQGKLTRCKTNLRNIATALDMYAEDNTGNYPKSLDRLADGVYLKALPTCPGASKMTYLDYQVSNELDFFSLSCCGDNHSDAYSYLGQNSRGYPKYNSKDGLIIQPERGAGRR